MALIRFIDIAPNVSLAPVVGRGHPGPNINPPCNTISNTDRPFHYFNRGKLFLHKTVSMPYDPKIRTQQPNTAVSPLFYCVLDLEIL